MKSGFCVLWGRPNAGKSTLLNAALGRKHVIVSPRPQTTRHRITGVLHGDDFQIVFLDTPGIHEPEHKLGEALVKTARGALQDVETVVFVADASDHPHADDKLAAELLAKGLNKQKVPVILALNKIDLARERKVDWVSHRTQFKALYDFDAIVDISALTGEGLPAFQYEIQSRLPEGDPYFPPDMLGDRPPEFHIEELIREQAMLQLREEVPHSVAAGVEQMEPRKNGTLFIEAVIYVERDSQKRIVIGQGGSRIKEIGQKARAGMQELLKRPVYLELRVKVRDKWRENDMWIQRLGYNE
jgi:GTP-binding protein Era